MALELEKENENPHVFTSEHFDQYIRERMHNYLLDSGIATRDKNITFGWGEKNITLPFLKRYYVSDEVMDDSTGMTLNELTIRDNVACIHYCTIQYNKNDIKHFFSSYKLDQVALADFLINKWDENIQIILAKTLEGAFASESMAESSIYGELSDDDSAMVKALYLIEGNLGKFSGVMMHSDVKEKLKRLDSIKFDVKSNTNTLAPYYMGQRVFINNNLVPIDGRYPIYFFGHGAIAFNENIDKAKVEYEYNTSETYNIVTSRRVFTMHPRGIKWAGNAMGVTPTKAELENGSNWKLIADRKNVAITRLMATL